MPEGHVVLADASIWIDHLRSPNLAMGNHLNENVIVTHPFILGELALGSLANRSALLRALDRLAKVKVARNDEVRQLIEQRRLFSRGIGWVDAHLVASTLIQPTVHLWTTDKRLGRVASEIGIQLHSGSLPN